MRGRRSRRDNIEIELDKDIDVNVDARVRIDKLVLSDFFAYGNLAEAEAGADTYSRHGAQLSETLTYARADDWSTEAYSGSVAGVDEYPII